MDAKDLPSSALPSPTPDDHPNTFASFMICTPPGTSATLEPEGGSPRRRERAMMEAGAPISEMASVALHHLSAAQQHLDAQIVRSQLADLSRKDSTPPRRRSPSPRFCWRAEGATAVMNAHPVSVRPPEEPEPTPPPRPASPQVWTARGVAGVSTPPDWTARSVTGVSTPPDWTARGVCGTSTPPRSAPCLLAEAPSGPATPPRPLTSSLRSMPPRTVPQRSQRTAPAVVAPRARYAVTPPHTPPMGHRTVEPPRNATPPPLMAMPARSSTPVRTTTPQRAVTPPLTAMPAVYAAAPARGVSPANRTLPSAPSLIQVGRFRRPAPVQVRAHP